jgi:sugar diacid utilization regulator
VTVGPEIRPAVDLGSLEAITDAVESGLGLPEVVRAAARALEASLVLSDRAGAVLAVAARSSADERALMTDAAGVTAHDLRVGDEVVGRLRLRGRSGDPDPSLLRVVTTLIASEVSRLQAPERATAAAQDAFVRAVLDRALRSRAEIVGRAADIGLDLESGSVVVVVRAHNHAATEDE